MDQEHKLHKSTTSQILLPIKKFDNFVTSYYTLI